ncbi:MAG: sulfotransferase family protein, partial [Acidithiobacillus sp.]
MSIMLDNRPIFVMGAERSGTTLLMAMLGCHPHIAVPEVAWLYPRFRPYVFSYGDLTSDANIRTLAEEMIFGLKTPFWGMKVNARTIVDSLVDNLRERSFAGVYCAMLELYAQEMARPRWGEKTPYNLFFVQQILEDFPNAQFIFITRDGRDASADYLASGFGPTNIYCAAEVWKMCQNAVTPWRKSLANDQWLDVKYEELVQQPHAVLKQVCAFIGEEFTTTMLEFFQTDIAKQRGATRDHAPLGTPVSTQYIGIYKTQLSVKEQKIFGAVATKELEEAGYKPDVDPAVLTDADISLYKELDGRIRAATLDAP